MRHGLQTRLFGCYRHEVLGVQSSGQPSNPCRDLSNNRHHDVRFRDRLMDILAARADDGPFLVCHSLTSLTWESCTETNRLGRRKAMGSGSCPKTLGVTGVKPRLSMGVSAGIASPNHPLDRTLGMIRHDLHLVHPHCRIQMCLGGPSRRNGLRPRNTSGPSLLGSGERRLI